MKSVVVIIFLFPFILNAQVELGICGNDTITGGVGKLKTMSVTGVYSNNESCKVLLMPHCASQIVFTFDNFHSEYMHDSLTIYDGDTTTAPVLASLSGTINSGTITSSGGQMLFVWSSDSAVVDSGFSGHWSALYTGPLTPAQCIP